MSLAGAGTYVNLVDEFNNGQQGPGQHEAPYLNATSGPTNLSVPPGTTLNLNRLRLYCYLNGEMHQVKAGEGHLFGGGLIVNRSQPEAGLKRLFVAFAVKQLATRLWLMR